MSVPTGILPPLKKRYEKVFLKIESGEETVPSSGDVSLTLSKSEVEEHSFIVRERIRQAGVNPNGENMKLNIVDFGDIVLGFRT